MSGLEVVGAVASIASLIDIGAKVYNRMKAFREDSTTLPDDLHHFKNQLPTYLEILRETKTAIDAGRVSPSNRKALSPLVKACHAQLKTLDTLIQKAMPVTTDSGGKRVWKAVISFRYDKDIKKAVEVVNKYLDTLTQQGVAAQRNQDVRQIQMSPPEPLKPHFVNKPFRRDPDFVDRAALADIISKAETPNPLQMIALYGIGGVGKSQIAIEYAYRTLDASPDTWVFWVHAGSVAEMEADYRSIAKGFRLPDSDDADINIFKVVNDYLSDDTNGRWVMILDNADDMDVFTAAPPAAVALPDNAFQTTAAPQILSFLPKSSTGSILITTIAKKIAHNLTGNANHCIELKEMNQDEAMELLQKKLSGTHNTDDMRELVKTLEFFPLAISQAAAFINERAPRETVASYNKIAKSQDLTKLLEASAAESHRDAGRSNSIVVTWQIAFRYILQKSPSAARLLTLMCLFDRQAIHESLLWGNYGERPSPLIPVPIPNLNRFRKKRYLRRLRKSMNDEADKLPAREVEFERDWATLQNYAFIKTHPGGTVFTMHRLIQLTAQSWLQSKGKFKLWTGRYIYALHHNYHEWAEKNAIIQTALYPHLRQVGSYRPSSREEIVIWASLLKSAIDYALSHAYSEEALTLSKTAFEIVLEVNGWESQATLQYSQRLSTALARTGHRDEAEALSRKTCDMRAKVLGLQHEDTLASMQTLAKILRGNGKAQEGLTLESRTIELYKATKGKGLTGLNEVWPVNFTWDVLSWIRQGKFKKAEERVRALYNAGPAAKREPGDWDTMAVVMTQQLAIICTQTERFAEAEALYRQIPYETPVNLLFLARVLEYRGKYQEAETMYRRVIKDCTEGDALERDSMNKDAMVGAMAGLASVLVKCNAVEEPVRLCQQVVETRKNQEGQHHEQFMALHTLAAMQEQNGSYEQALEMYEIAHKGLAAVLGDHFLDTKACLRDIAAIKEKIARPEDADAMLARGKALEEQGNDGEAEGSYRRAAWLKSEGDVRYGEPPLAAMESLIQLLSKQGRVEEAENEGLVYSFLRARALRQQEKFVEALEICKVAYEGTRKKLGEEQQFTQTIFGLLEEIQQKVTESEAQKPKNEGGHIPGQWEE